MFFWHTPRTQFVKLTNCVPGRTTWRWYAVAALSERLQDAHPKAPLRRSHERLRGAPPRLNFLFALANLQGTRSSTGRASASLGVVEAVTLPARVPTPPELYTGLPATPPPQWVSAPAPIAQASTHNCESRLSSTALGTTGSTLQPVGGLNRQPGGDCPQAHSASCSSPRALARAQAKAAHSHSYTRSASRTALSAAWGRA